jgi:hypothetical protein
MLNRIRIRRALTGVAASALMLAVVTAVPAAASVKLRGTCNLEGAAPVFASFGDGNGYVAVDNGGFEGGDAGWSLSPGAAVIGENESFRLGGADHTRSLALSEGASAVSAGTCVGVDTPTFRFVLRGSDSSKAKLKVEVVYLEVGKKESRVVGELKANRAWVASPRLDAGLKDAVDVNGDGVSTVAFRFTAEGGSVSVDDVYLDPWMRR